MQTESAYNRKERIKMKKFKKIIALGLAATVAVSAMSMSSAFAVENTTSEMQVIPAESNIVAGGAYTPKVGDTLVYLDNNGERKTAVITLIDTPVPIENEYGIEPMWVSKWFYNTRINRNVSGNNGTQVGSSYRATYADGHAAIKTKNWSAHLNALNYSVVDETDGTATWGTLREEYPGGVNVAVPTEGHYYHYVFSGESSTNNTLTCDLMLLSDY